MPTNLYGPNDNFDLERSHVLPAMIRKIYLADRLLRHDEEAVRTDLSIRPVEDIDGSSSFDDILSLLKRYGITAEKVSLWGTGRPMREFLWSEEMADACVFLMEHCDFADMYPHGTQEIRNCHINIGTGEEISIRDLASLIAKAIGYDGLIEFDSSKPDGTMRKLTDVSKLHALGWKHRIDITTGVRMLVDWYRPK